MLKALLALMASMGLTTPAIAQSVSLPASCYWPNTGRYIDELMQEQCRDALILREIERQQESTASPRTAPTEQNVIVTRRDDINLRSGNSLTSAVIGNLDQGTTVYLMERVSSRDGDGHSWRWIRVESGKHKGKYGYVREDLI